MNTPIEQFFPHIFVINLKRRPDRWERIEVMLENIGITNFERFDAVDKPLDHNGQKSGNAGCVASHRALLELIAKNKWPWTLVLEDDCEIAPTGPEMQGFVDPQAIFRAGIGQIPPDADMIFLGGGYADPPKYRVSEHVIRFNKMMTTSSYGITWQMARRMAPKLLGVGPIDSLFGGFQETSNCYIFEPRLFVQGESLSDLTDKVDDNRHSMLDRRHVEMLIDGNWRPGSTDLFDSTLFRRELAASTDMNGETVIIGRDRYTVRGVSTPSHKAPWFRGEPVTYLLERQ